MHSTMTTQTLTARSRLPLRYALGVVIVTAISLSLFTLVLRPSTQDIRLMGIFLSFTSLISILAGYAAYRMGWVDKSPTLRWTLMGGYALSSLLTFINVWMTARLMFTSQHDLLLATILLLFASGIAITFGLFICRALT